MFDDVDKTEMEYEMTLSPKAYPFLNTLDVDQDVKRRLALQLNGIELGSSNILYTPLGEEGRAETILSEVDKMFKENSATVNEVLFDLEISNKDKFGPRSRALPWSERKRQLDESFEYDSLLDRLDNNVPPSGNRSLRPIDYPTALKLLKNDTNSGLPDYTRKGIVKKRVLENIDEYLEEDYPCLLFTRTQENWKTRTVWGYPIADVLREMRFYSPLLSYQKNLPYRAALIGPEEVSRKVRDIVLACQKSSRTIVSIDFIHFDDNAKGTLQSLAFQDIKSKFQYKYQDEISELQKRFLTIGILTPDGIKEGPHGIPSGSPFTNEVGSLVQLIPAKQLPFIDENFMQVQGDDGVYLVPKDCEDKLIKQFESYGLKVNKTKSYTSDKYAIYLQCLHHIDYISAGIIGGIYPIYRALNRLCFQERWSKFEDHDITGRDYYSIRALCILENCKYHPLFENFVKIIHKYDKYSLDFTSQGLSNYVHMLESANGAEGILNNQYGDNTRGLRNFESYKIVKRLS
jgi:hypothetical protein